MVGQASVFVGRDYIMNDDLDRLAERLQQELGCKVIRGWGAKPPAHTDYPPEEWPDLFGQADVLVVSTRTRLPVALLDAAPRLRAVVFPSIGSENLDKAAATARGIVVANGASAENFESMAEATAMLAAALLLDLPGKQANFRDNAPRPMPKDLKGRMVKGKTIGLIGLGRIARGVVTRFAGWDVRIVACDPYVRGEQVPAGVEMTDLDTLLRSSDVISVHVAITDETRAMIGARELALMKPDAYLINTARGLAIDEPALLDALGRGRLAGAALDVFLQEPLPADHPLRGYPNLILTQHIIGHTRELFDAIVPTAMENIRRILSGEPPLHLLNPAVLPAWRERGALLDR